MVGARVGEDEGEGEGEALNGREGMMNAYEWLMWSNSSRFVWR
jgi:hypothetical protein